MGYAKIMLLKKKKKKRERKEIAHELLSIVIPREGKFKEAQRVNQKKINSSFKKRSTKQCSREECAREGRSIIIINLATKYSTHLHTLDLE
jgi:hypothetical protein